VRAVYDKVASVAAEAVSVATVLQPLLDMNQDRDTRSFAIVLPAKVALDKDLRDAATRAEKRLEEFQVEMTMRKDVFDNIWAFRLVHLAMLQGLYNCSLIRVDWLDACTVVGAVFVVFLRLWRKICTICSHQGPIPEEIYQTLLTNKKQGNLD
jgi:hypothetical protein